MTTSTPTKTLAQWEAELPEAPKPVAAYVPTVKTGNLLYTSGVLPMQAGQLAHAGALTPDDPQAIANGQAAARLCLMNALALIKDAAGSLNNVARVVKLVGFVSSSAAFYNQPQVVNGASELLLDVFGEEIGKHARSAVGVAALPLNASVELELIVELK
ncbi:MAG: RidA family protein [Vampirovibrionales bacterium]|nr:RidA family protein [Vampirovibrionales bacterium]